MWADFERCARLRDGDAQDCVTSLSFGRPFHLIGNLGNSSPWRHESSFSGLLFSHESSPVLQVLTIMSPSRKTCFLSLHIDSESLTPIGPITLVPVNAGHKLPKGDPFLHPSGMVNLLDSRKD